MRALTIVLAPCHSFICIGRFVAQDIQRGANEVNVATPSVLNITELLTRVDNDRELVSELFLISPLWYAAKAARAESH